MTSDQPRGCGPVASISTRWHQSRQLSRNEFENLGTDGSDDAKPTAGFQRVIQRRIIIAASSREVTGAKRADCDFLSESESHAAYF